MASPNLDKLHREISETRFFEGLSAVDNWDEALGQRGQAEFDNAWTESQRALSSKHYLHHADEIEVTNLRESVFKAVFRLTSNAEAAGYVSDDFGLIGEAVSKGCLSEWIEWLLKVYRSGKFPW
ncbi:hypothetical protein [Pseudomonas sp. W5-01]|uniref:hypothetical protein n=1 Tax=Pseudomonas sp. W5-01 TaxID=3097454 RepID=UPI00397B24BD